MHGPSGRCSASPVLTQRCCSNNLGKVARFAACSPLLRASSSPCQDALKSTLLPPYALYRVGVVFGASPLQGKIGGFSCPLPRVRVSGSGRLVLLLVPCRVSFPAPPRSCQRGKAWTPRLVEGLASALRQNSALRGSGASVV